MDIRGRVAAKLPFDRVHFFPELSDVTRPPCLQPPVSIPVEHDLPRFGPVVGAGRVPQTTIEDHRGALWRQNWNPAVDHPFPVTSGESHLVLQLASRNHVEISSPRLARVRQEVSHLDRQTWPRTRLHLLVHPPCILVPPKTHSALTVRGLDGCHIQMGEVDMNVPPQDPPDFGQESRIGNKVDKGLVLTQEFPCMDTLVGTDLLHFARFHIHAFGRLDQLPDACFRKGVSDDEISIPVERTTFGRRQAVLQAASIHGKPRRW